MKNPDAKDGYWLLQNKRQPIYTKSALTTKARLAAARRLQNAAGNLQYERSAINEPGKGQKITYSLEQASQYMLALILSQVGIEPTAIVLEITTIPISERMPCQAVAERTPDKRPPE